MAIKKTKEGISVAIEVIPNAKETKIFGFNEWRNSYQLKVNAKAEKGEANKEIIKFFAELLSVKNSEIEIIGERSRRKIIVVRNVREEEVAKKLES